MDTSLALARCSELRGYPRGAAWGTGRIRFAADLIGALFGTGHSQNCKLLVALTTAGRFCDLPSLVPGAPVSSRFANSIQAWPFTRHLRDKPTALAGASWSASSANAKTQNA